MPTDNTDDEIFEMPGTQLTDLQREHLVAACDAIIESDTEHTITSIIVWPDASKPGGVSTLIFDEVEGDDKVDIFLAADETEARQIHAWLSAADARPLVAIGQ